MPLNYVTEAVAETMMCCNNTTWQCVASHCMAWRWGEGTTDPPTPLSVGFCGWAGIPQNNP